MKKEWTEQQTERVEIKICHIDSVKTLDFGMGIVLNIKH